MKDMDYQREADEIYEKIKALGEDKRWISFSLLRKMFPELKVIQLRHRLSRLLRQGKLERIYCSFFEDEREVTCWRCSDGTEKD